MSTPAKVSEVLDSTAGHGLLERKGVFSGIATQIGAVRNKPDQVCNPVMIDIALINILP